MAGKNTSVFGIYGTREDAEEGVGALVQNGFRHTDISVLLPEGAATGTGSGTVVGGTMGLLAGIGALAIPGLGPFIAAGPIMGALAGIGYGPAGGGIVGALIGMGIPEYEAKRYEGKIREGGALVSAHCDSSDWVKRAKEVLERTGARDISSTGEVSGDYAASDSLEGDPRIRPRPRSY